MKTNKQLNERPPPYMHEHLHVGPCIYIVHVYVHVHCRGVYMYYFQAIPSHRRAER